MSATTNITGIIKNPNEALGRGLITKQGLRAFPTIPKTRS
jgi:hypothetical protein